MSITETLEELLRCLRDALEAPVQQAVQEVFGDEWDIHINRLPPWDFYGVMKVIQINWKDVFQTRLPPDVRNITYELVKLRNRFAHQQQILDSDVAMAFIQGERILSAFQPLYPEMQGSIYAIIERVREIRNRYLVRFAHTSIHGSGPEPMHIAPVSGVPYAATRPSPPSVGGSRKEHSNPGSGAVDDMEIE
eukprot:TRINITY_DN6305_c0_g4_i7.p1 TRINITY_DN6305_c0_g4~~TRINITY_DN6305_c0_g4_i7.p1  ORF type:complete len:192 (+),score=44.02 TRINITY_DN6305_c0_g4_i7:48-623(+)